MVAWPTLTPRRWFAASRLDAELAALYPSIRTDGAFDPHCVPVPGAWAQVYESAPGGAAEGAFAEALGRLERESLDLMCRYLEACRG